MGITLEVAHEIMHYQVRIKRTVGFLKAGPLRDEFLHSGLDSDGFTVPASAVVLISPFRPSIILLYKKSGTLHLLWGRYCLCIAIKQDILLSLLLQSSCQINLPFHTQDSDTHSLVEDVWEMNMGGWGLQSHLMGWRRCCPVTVCSGCPSECSGFLFCAMLRWCLHMTTLTTACNRFPEMF